MTVTEAVALLDNPPATHMSDNPLYCHDCETFIQWREFIHHANAGHAVTS